MPVALLYLHLANELRQAGSKTAALSRSLQITCFSLVASRHIRQQCVASIRRPRKLQFAFRFSSPSFLRACRKQSLSVIFNPFFGGCASQRCSWGCSDSSCSSICSSTCQRCSLRPSHAQYLRPCTGNTDSAPSPADAAAATAVVAEAAVFGARGRRQKHSIWYSACCSSAAEKSLLCFLCTF